MRLSTVIVGAACVLLGALPWMSALAGPEKQPLRSPGNLRLDDLAPKSAEELDQELFSPAGQPAAQPSPEQTGPRASETLDKQLRKELGRAGQSEADNPLVDIARMMHQVGQRINKADSGQETQQMQGQILSNLDTLLEQARRQCQACQGACQPGQQAVAQRQKIELPRDIEAAKHVKRKNSGGGADPSRAIAGPDRVSPAMKVIHQPNMEEMRSLLKALWGELPERERQQMLQLPVEEFLPKYELLIEQYFKRLAEQQDQPAVGRGR